MKRKGILIGIVIIIVIICSMFLDEEKKQLKYESWIPWKNEIKEKQTIRVLLKNNGFQGITHEKVEVSSEHGLYVLFGEEFMEIPKTEIFNIDFESELFKNNRIQIKPIKESDVLTIHHLHRGYGTPSYGGILELFWTEEGIVIVNELDVELYLEHVVPSEMPSSYEEEALKVQAICARSYAYRQMEGMAYPEYDAHVDDSTSYQVYGNSEKKEKTTRAVKETKGEVVKYKGEVASTYFFSTSSGKTAGIEAWNVKNIEKYPYLRSVAVETKEGKAYEEKLPWYSWELTAAKDDFKRTIESFINKSIGELESLKVIEYGAGGVALKVRVEGTEEAVEIESENKIRRALGDSAFIIERQDGSSVACSDLLPSAFFTIIEEKDTYTLQGGGYGHSIGMSQNGVNEMAKEGKEYREIIEFFYPGTVVE